MGKAARLKALRQGEKGSARAGNKAASTPGSQKLLEEAVIAIGLIFGTEPACAEAGALLYSTAKALGYELRPRPVSVLFRDNDSGQEAYMGPKATAMIADADPDKVTDLRPDGQDNGHLVLTCDDPKLLLDPNIRQLSVTGVDVPSIMMRIRSTQPESGDWQGKFGGIDIWYILDEDHDVLLRHWDTLVKMSRPHASELIRMLRMGMSAEQISRRAVTRGAR